MTTTPEHEKVQRAVKKPAVQEPEVKPQQAEPSRAVSRAAALMPPPDGSPPPMRAAQAISAGAPGVVSRARMMNGLQASAGNARAGRMVVQARMSVSQPGDPHEREAEHVAATVMRMPDAGGPHADTASAGEPEVKGRCPACEQAHRLCAECEKEVHRKADHSGAPAVGNAAESEIKARQGGGQPLARSARDFLEPRFGRDFSDVRVHSDAGAARLARSVNAEAFTTGKDVFFGEGRYQPDTSSGRGLLAHELTHTVQQGHDKPSVSRQDTPPAPGAQSVKESADLIFKDLTGATFWWNSTEILQQFQGKAAGPIRALLAELKSRAAEVKETSDTILRRMLKDMGAGDARELRNNILIAKHVTEDLIPILVEELVKMLRQVLSSVLGVGADVLGIMGQFGGETLDDILHRMEGGAGKSENDMPDYMFDQIDRVSADKLRTHFVEAGGPRAFKYAAFFTASKIHKMLDVPSMSHSESSMVVANFSDPPTPAQMRPVVQMRLDQLARASSNMSAEDLLMKQLDQVDYETIQKYQGLKLRPFDRKVTTMDKVTSALKWADMVAAWIVCGIVGIVTGLVAAAIDIIKGLIDIGAAIKHIIGAVAYLVSGGAVGSEDVLALKDFFVGIRKTIADPGEAFDQMWSELKDEFRTIEGPYADCKRAEFIVRKVVGVIVNLVLIFVAGYGIAKAAVTAIVEFAELANEIGVIQALVRTGVKAGRAIVKFARAEIGKIAEFANSLLRPAKLILKIKNQLNAILLAVQDEGVWGYMRGHTGKLAENEREFWKDQRTRWQERALKAEDKNADLADRAGQFKQGMDRKEAPVDDKGEAQRFNNNADNLEDDVDNLEKDVKGDPKEPNKDAPPQLPPGNYPKEYLEWEKSLSPDSQKALAENEALRRAYAEMDPEVRRTLTLCESPCIPTDPIPSPENVKKIRDMLKKLKLPDDDMGLREYFHRRRENLSEAIQGVEDVADINDLRNRLNKGIADMAAKRGIKATLRPDGRWEAVNKAGVTVLEFDVGPYEDLPGSNSFFQRHHGVQGEWAEQRLGKLYDYDRAPTIQLRDSHAGTPHQLVTERQAGRKGTFGTRTYDQELADLRKDLADAGVPPQHINRIADDSNRFFTDIYNDLKATDPSKLKDIFGTWKP